MVTIKLSDKQIRDIEQNALLAIAISEREDAKGEKPDISMGEALALSAYLDLVNALLEGVVADD